MRLPILYVFNFKPEFIEKAVRRLCCSLESILKQVDKVYILNASRDPVIINTPFLNKIVMVHKPFNGYFNKSVLINYAVKHLIPEKTEYFIFSDIDLIYPDYYVNKMQLEINKYNEPVRIIPKNAVINQEYYSSNYNDLATMAKRIAQHATGESHGNGVIHKPSFMQIRGYNEYYLGYSPEDQSFNQRISKINKFIFQADLVHYHLWHQRLNMQYSNENMMLFETERNEIIKGNLIFNKDVWGEY